MPIHVELVTQEKRVFEEPEADMIIVPGSEGEMGILPHHAPVLTTLGVVDVRPDKVVVLADLAESSFDLDMEAIEAARQSASKLMAEGVPATENRNAALALRRAELAARIQRKITSRPSAVMRIIDEESEA
jgi:F-type H+-transporting ATPase subunit epsilon